MTQVSSFSLQNNSFIIVQITTPLLNRGWVPQTSRSFHFWQPASRWDCSHGWQILATQPWAPKQKGRRVLGTIQKLCLNAEWRYSKHEGSISMWTREDHWLQRLTNASSKHALVQMHERTQQHARESRPLTEALAQIPNKTSLSMN